jgi:hypothetical protein
MSPTPNRLIPGTERVRERERGQGREAARAAALDRQPVAVDVAPFDEEERRRHAVLDVDLAHAPLSISR